MDDRKNKVEQFFYDKLQDFSEQSGDWNEPPEHIWETSQAAFPSRKKEKTNRLLWIPIFGIGLILSGLIIGYFFMTDNQTQKAQLIAERNTSTPVSYPTKIENSGTKNTLTYEDQKIKTDPLTITPQISKEPIANQNTNSKSNLSLGTIKRNHNDSNKILNQRYSKKSENSSNNDFISSISNLNSFEKQKNIENNTKKTNTLGTINNQILSNENAKTIKPRKNNGQQENPIEIQSYTFLPKKELPFISDENKLELTNTTPKLGFIETKSPKHWKWEYGISHMGFFKSQVSDPDINSTNMIDEATFKTVYQNLNLHISKNLDNTWSLSSGINYTAMNIVGNFKNNFIYISGFNEIEIRTNVNNLSPGSLNFNDELEPLQLELLPGLNLADGTLVQFHLEFPFIFRIIEVPLELHYHINVKQWELVIGGGIDLNYMYARLDPTAIMVYHEDKLINTPIYSNALSGHGLAWNINSTVMTKYHINSSLNIAGYIKLVPFEEDYSRGGLGLYYRM